MRRSLEIRPESDLLLGQQLKNFPASRCASSLIGKRAVKGDILPGEKSVQTHGIHMILVRHFPVFHLRFDPPSGVCARQPFNGTARSALR
jgi:hypothetical protein